MKTRYTPLVKIRKSDLERCEREAREANINLQNAQHSLQEAYGTLQNIHLPASGKIQDMLSTKTVIQMQRKIINDKKEYLLQSQRRVEYALSQLKSSHIEYEKFKYLELEEIKKALKANAIKESKELDEIAILTHNRGQE